MKPIHLNLAAHPYRDYRPVYAVVVVLSLLTAFLMLNNVETYYRYQNDTSSTTAKIGRIESQTQQEQHRKEIAEQKLGSLDLAALDAQTRFVNAKLAERAFSWSMLLDELESVIPQDVRLVSVAPGFNGDGSISLGLTLAAKGPNGMITTINRIHADPQFSNPFPGSENRNEDGTFAFNLTVQYRPPAMPRATKASTR